MTDYDPSQDCLQSYILARQLQREKLLRDGKWITIGPRDEHERNIAKEGKK